MIDTGAAFTEPLKAFIIDCQGLIISPENHGTLIGTVPAIGTTC